MGEPWTVDETRVLAEVACFPVLQAERAGRKVVKAEYLRRAERRLQGRTHHTLKDRCYRISEVLRDAGYPWVQGWKPPSMVGQHPNSEGVTAMTRAAVLPLAEKLLGPPSR